MKRLVQFKKADDFIFPLIENICKLRKLRFEEVSSLFTAKCEGCGTRLDGLSLAMAAALIMSGQAVCGCPNCGHEYFVAEISTLTGDEEARLKKDRFFKNLVAPRG